MLRFVLNFTLRKIVGRSAFIQRSLTPLKELTGGIWYKKIISFSCCALYGILYVVASKDSVYCYSSKDTVTSQKRCSVCSWKVFPCVAFLGEDFKTVQKEVAEILKGRILVGHALKNDLKVH